MKTFKEIVQEIAPDEFGATSIIPVWQIAEAYATEAIKADREGLVKVVRVITEEIIIDLPPTNGKVIKRMQSVVSPHSILYAPLPELK